MENIVNYEIDGKKQSICLFNENSELEFELVFNKRNTMINSLNNLYSIYDDEEKCFYIMDESEYVLMAIKRLNDCEHEVTDKNGNSFVVKFN